MSDAATSVVYRLKESLRRISPMIWRRLLVPAGMTLYELHRAISGADPSAHILGHLRAAF